MVCNPLSCSGFSTALFGTCSMVWLVGVLLFFIIVFSRKWVIEPMGIQWSNLGAFLLGYVALFLTAALTCSHKIALVLGLVGAIIGGVFGAKIFGETTD